MSVVLMTFSDVIDYHDEEVLEGNFLKCYFFRNPNKLCLMVVKRQIGGQNFNQFEKTPVCLDIL